MNRVVASSWSEGERKQRRMESWMLNNLDLVSIVAGVQAQLRVKHLKDQGLTVVLPAWPQELDGSIMVGVRMLHGAEPEVRLPLKNFTGGGFARVRIEEEAE